MDKLPNGSTLDDILPKEYKCGSCGGTVQRWTKCETCDKTLSMVEKTLKWYKDGVIIAEEAIADISEELFGLVLKRTK